MDGKSMARRCVFHFVGYLPMLLAPHNVHQCIHTHLWDTHIDHREVQSHIYTAVPRVAAHSLARDVQRAITIGFGPLLLLTHIRTTTNTFGLQGAGGAWWNL